MKRMLTFMLFAFGMNAATFAGDQHVVSASVDHQCLCSTSSRITIELHLKGFTDNVSIIWQYSSITDGKNWSVLTGQNKKYLTTDSVGIYRAKVTEHGSCSRDYYSPDIYIGECRTLPLNFGSIDGIANNGRAFITWTTSMEDNVSHFVVQSSEDGVSFTVVDTVKAAGTSSTIQTYHVTVSLSESSVTFYRIMSVDIDGAVSFSKVITVTAATAEQKRLVVYPNPAKNVINFMDNKNGHKFVITNLSGIRMMTGTIDDMKVSVTNLPKGMYTLYLDDGSKATFEKQ
ncbi:MAG TPA: T9SS type A sorting domain-containing protein [Candidatus Paceibacterota bacterium]|nr:T9SS type A sorting domain-containing protein [Candidatus Paceibacterota bacterium]